MFDRRLLNDPRLLRARAQAEHLYRSHRLRRWLLFVGIAVVVFGPLGFFAAPPLLKSQLQQRLGARLGRPVTIGEVHLNPYTLELELDQLHVGDKDRQSAFVDVDRLVINASWSSLFRWAPVLDELTLQHPQLHLVRLGPQRFNFSDLLAGLTGPADPKAAPARFALANISVHDGDILFDDKVLGTSHRIDQIELGIPFLANLPATTDLFVKPLLAARIDGSPLRIEGRTKPFASSRESVIEFQLDHLDLPRYLGYVPAALPVAILRGQLSGKLELHFTATDKDTRLRLGGQLSLDDFSLTTPGGAALLELGHGSAELTDVQPLLSRYHLGRVLLDQATMHYRVGADGHSNFDALTAAGTPLTAPVASANDVQIHTLDLQRSRLDYTDASDAVTTAVTLKNLHGSLVGLSTVPAPAATLVMAAQLNGGGLGVTGKLDLAGARFDGRLALNTVVLAPLQSLAMPQLQARITKGKLDAHGQLQASWGKQVNLHIEPAQLTISNMALQQDPSGATPVAWKSVKVKLNRFDLAARNAQVGTVAVKGLKLDVKRLRNGRLDLAALLAPATTPPSPTSNHTPRATAPAWHWQVDRLTLDDGNVAFVDLTANHPVPVDLHADHYRVDALSSDLRQPLTVALTGELGRGRYDVSGKVTLQPLVADLRVHTHSLDMAPLQSLISVPLNVRIGSALLSLDGQFGYRDQDNADARISYRGTATLGRVRVQDKLTGDDFLRWHSLVATGLLVRLGEGAPHADIGGLALSDFYARVIINSSGRLNLQDVVATGAGAAAVSVTRAESSSAPAATAATTPATGLALGPRPEIRIGQITLARGQLNYTDNFIKPNYTANVTDLAGSIGAFGTREGSPAPLVLQGKLDENSPVDINGSINPLTPVAFLDIRAKAEDVELTHLSPYSGKYAGYPITGGVLNVDVHYMLDQRKLTADNHIFIEQLTFGDRITTPCASHLPVKLAVALLSNAQGQIDVHVPVSGSLDDPKFNMGGLIWHAFVNLIAHAATAPFRLLASIGGGKHPDLGYVEFAPGSVVLNDAALSRLTRLMKLLLQKPSLKLDITGRMDPAVDEKGLRAVMVDDLVHKEKAEHDGDKVDPSTIKLTSDEYVHYLTRAYRHARFPKAKNLIGFTKSQPPQEMRQLLEAHMPVDAGALRQLADRRAAAVQRWLQGKIDPQRLSVHPPSLDAKGINDNGKTTRVDFGLH